MKLHRQDSSSEDVFFRRSSIFEDISTSRNLFFIKFLCVRTTYKAKDDQNQETLLRKSLCT
ncbi:hypothetical protein TYRP_020782 [Tyrophagus putrescentiae]|nr:hypothetical protein TYRP_020782 [Tyrophagus putrescentiae]